MEKKQLIVDARKLIAKGKVRGNRPVVQIHKTRLTILPLSIVTAPKAPLDAVLLFGMGPVHLSIVHKYLHHTTVAVGQSRMKHNSIAALELSAHGFVNKKGLIIPSGTATADPDLIEIVKNLKHVARKNMDAVIAKVSLESEKYRAQNEPPQESIVKPMLSKKIEKETEKLYTTSEAEIMEWLFLNGHSKVMREDGSGRVMGKNIHIEIFRDNLATETIDNLINAINELDKRSRAMNKILFNGSLGAITSRYHVARTMETARYLGLGNQVVPLISQEVLRYFGYDPRLFRGGWDFDIATRWNEQKWTRALHQIPDYILPVLPQIHDDERLVEALFNLKNIYGEKVFETHGIKNISLRNIDHLRKNLKLIVRTNPKVEEWMKTDVKEINEAIDGYIQFTHTWLAANTPSPKAS